MGGVQTAVAAIHAGMLLHGHAGYTRDLPQQQLRDGVGRWHGTDPEADSGQVAVAPVTRKGTDVLDRHVRYRLEEAVGWVTLDRPETMTAVSEEVFADLFDVKRAANDDPEVRVLITGQDRTSP